MYQNANKYFKINWFNWFDFPSNDSLTKYLFTINTNIITCFICTKWMWFNNRVGIFNYNWVLLLLCVLLILILYVYFYCSEVSDFMRLVNIHAPCAISEKQSSPLMKVLSEYQTSEDKMQYELDFSYLEPFVTYEIFF